MTILERIYHQHDVVCNQKYDDTLPYSFHLKCVVAQAEKYKYLIPLKVFTTRAEEQMCIKDSDRNSVVIAAAGHDLIEDARMTYNDVKDLVGSISADIIYACTDLKGKTREERHSQEFFDELKKNRLAVFVKLCDTMANVLFSKLTNSSMLKKYKKEFTNLYSQLYVLGEYDDLWNDLELTIGDTSRD